ncbi:hypothetical protein BpHYR1_006485 [Brachionus plicatilis]|uniref:Uncharacterized protein n=1 Tax=Brachionus plicatilis TaxID=10195 RepID=A0A3M7PJI5_BRAPC|nr:hypothetical protein BpHYR1_006485 [Brachionus plicatilis]
MNILTFVILIIGLIYKTIRRKFFLNISKFDMDKKKHIMSNNVYFFVLKRNKHYMTCQCGAKI